MKIAIIGTTGYKGMMVAHSTQLQKVGHIVRIPAFDDMKDLDELGVCEYNRGMIEWSEEVHVFWDQRSMGTIFDFGMLFALRKQFRIMYMEKKTFRGVMEKYQKQCLEAFL